MTVRLNKRAYKYACKLIESERCALDSENDWPTHRPAVQKENDYIKQHGIASYARWFLGFDDSEPENSKNRYKFLYGDFIRMHHCALLAAEDRAAQYYHADIEQAVAQLRAMAEAGAVQQVVK